MRQTAPKLLDAEALFQYALRLLGGKASSTGDLKEKLKRRAAGAADIDPVIARCKEYGYLNDKKFAESYAAARLENQSHGRGRVLRDLRQRRIAPALAEKTVGAVFEGVDEVALIETYLKKKFRGKDLPQYLSEEKHLASAYRRLRTAGFTTGNAIRVLKRFSARADELEGTDTDES
ncbi:MAG: RecX family transcriptional regulator [Acidobacteria bacterium]|nr:RecX family transcriptional regulator [Acidobacteriota bacterium]